VAGKTVVLTATVTSGCGTPIGTVTFAEGAITLGTAPLFNGVATFSSNTLAAGVHSITAAYNGNNSFNASTSAAVTQTVTSGG
jgi:hypothetical protein